ncbi:E3 ubiquitin-protein ligase RFWD3-like [Cydia pomonella]|uniref:E3 ubiquitin-protein ligase RFWD3-like n=1 Tax=Cydia pomonella TaxID=82600 RepID=UPI002ADE84A0|nr:E3 ubiquitin-protein ligase RFWD3-like [Cydia pomonella]
MGSSPPYFPARDSPSILEPVEDPSPPRSPSPVLRAPSPVRLQHSGTYTPRDNSNGSFPNDDNNSNSIDGVFPSPSTYTFDPEESDSSLAQWPRRDNAAPSPFVSNENSMFSTAMSNEESNSLPEVSVRGEGSERGDDADEPPAKIRKVSSPKQSPQQDDGDGETCPICLDSWCTSGDHRLVALKCGHLFGLRCVERWLKAQTQRERCCPTCKSKATMKDVRNIYARKIIAVDTSEITTMQKQVEQVTVEKSRVELELQKSKIAHRACLQQLETLRNTLLKAQVKPQVKRSWRFALEKNLEICKDGGCRVMTYNCRTYELYVSQKSTNGLFPGYGIRKVSCVDYKQGQFVHLHPKPIRDISYSQPKDLLLSVGLDSCARIVERGIPSTTVQAGVQLWSCAWDGLRTNEFYVGGVGGFIQQYDIRNPSSYIQQLSAPGDMSPVVSLCPTEFGLLSCNLNSCWLWSWRGNGQWEPRSLPVEGPFMSMCYDNETRRALVSCRPANGERARLSLCQFRNDDDVTCHVEQTFQGSVRSSIMSRAAWVRAEGATWLASHSESAGALVLHGLDGARGASLPAAEPAIDVCSVQLNGDTLLAALSEARLRIYKAVPTS